jgi:hypothetical protein
MTISDAGPELEIEFGRTKKWQFQCYEGDKTTELVVEATDVFRFKIWATDGAAPLVDFSNLAAATATFTADDGTDVITSAAHGLSNGQAVRLTTTTTLPGGLALNTTYWVRDAATNTFKLAASSGGAAIDITSTGTGTHTWTRTASQITVDTVGLANTTPATVTVKLDQVDSVGLTADTYYDWELALVDDSDDDKIKTIVRGKMLCVGSATGSLGLTG